MLKKAGRSRDVTTEPPKLYRSYYKMIAALAVQAWKVHKCLVSSQLGT